MEETMRGLENFFLGRIVLHLVCALRAGRWRWHCAGIWREMPLRLHFNQPLK
jgi:hypothetical protein